ncbi:hypothetical protein E2C01_066433 [Portunus trituberculatus]|uniref:Uncharacterized protein n=1 Tax=Portunus trituberculatus TaxID=210409 RepID=A0A5B7HQW9_PORTR|nr:hypothetical protein [Portunus trituberculatus]
MADLPIDPTPVHSFRLLRWTYSHVRDRRAQTLLTRLRIGHTYLTQRYLLTRDPQPYCEDCLMPFTVRHVLVRSRRCPRYRLEQDILQLDNSQFISLGSARRELLYRQKDGTGATFYASLAARSSGESAGQKTTPSATSRSVGAIGPVHLANRFFLLPDDLVESSLRSYENSTDLTKVTHIVDVHLPPVSPKPLKGLTKRHRGSAESIQLAQAKQSKVSPGARDRESSRDRSAMVAPVVSVQPSVTPSVSDRAS